MDRLKRKIRNELFVIRGYFELDSVKNVTLNVIGLGFFKCYINGQCVNPDTFLPLSSDYENSCDPKDEVLTSHRIYAPSFDITPFVKSGKNVIAIHFGGGWYTHKKRVFGLPKVIYRICAENGEGNIREFVSGERCRISQGFISDYEFVKFEVQDHTLLSPCFDVGFDDSNWENATVTEALDTEYCTTDCPRDALIKELPPKELGRGENGGTVYDCEENTVGYPVLEISAKAGERVDVYFSEELLPNGNLDPTHGHKQMFSVISDGSGSVAQPEFTWYGFRYFEVVGNAIPKCVKVVHADIPVTSSFECDNETLNWTYKTYTNTVNHYKKIGCFDTGIFATDILTRILFERGDSELAVDLLTSDGAQGFEHWRQGGATTFHEYWDSNRSRSHSHPMFGAPVAYFFEYLPGIKQKENTAGYSSLVIEPQLVKKINRMSGSMQTPRGRVAVSYEKNGSAVSFKIEIPKDTQAIFRFSGEERPLTEGMNAFSTAF